MEISPSCRLLRSVAQPHCSRGLTNQPRVVTVLAENPTQPINEATAAPVLLAAVKGAFTLAARR